MKQNFKTEFKPYLDTLKKDNTELKNRFNQDKFILRLRKKARQKILAAINPKTGLLDWNKLPKIITRNTKLIKSDKYEIFTAGIMMAPSSWSGYNVCSNASFGCGVFCLTVSGHGERHMQDKNGNHNVHIARIIRAILYYEYREQFLSRLTLELAAHQRKAKKLGALCGFRPNTTSDLSWEKIKVKDNKTLFELFPDVQFYDYTKVITRDITGIKNYHLTFSLNERNSLLVGLAFKKNMNVTVVIRNKKIGNKWAPKPTTYTLNGITKKVIDGDIHDARFIDEKDCFILLDPKGKDTLKDTTGFVRELN